MTVQSVEAVIQNSMAAQAAIDWYQSRLGFVCVRNDVISGPILAELFQCPESISLQRWILRLGEAYASFREIKLFCPGIRTHHV